MDVKGRTQEMVNQVQQGGEAFEAIVGNDPIKRAIAFGFIDGGINAAKAVVAMGLPAEVVTAAFKQLATMFESAGSLVKEAREAGVSSDLKSHIDEQKAMLTAALSKKPVAA